MSEAAFTLVVEPDGKLTLLRAGEPDAVDVRLRRAFPLSRGNDLVAVRSSDAKELLLIETPATLAGDQQKIIDDYFRDNVFRPRISSVESIDATRGFQQWRVVTDRGPIEFRVQEREDVRYLPDGRFVLKDVDGNVYELPRIDALDGESRKRVEALL